MTRSVMLGDRRESPWDETKHLIFNTEILHFVQNDVNFTFLIAFIL